MRFPTPRLYLGTMTFGWPSQTSSVVDETAARQMMKHFLASDVAAAGDGGHDGGALHFVDTARIYAGGKTESILGSVLAGGLTPSERSQVVLGTKAHPSQPMGLSAAGIRAQFDASLQAMGVTSVGEFYLHQPDPDHSLLESLRCAHELVTEGKACTIGMSNYQASEMERTFQLCEEHKLTKPTVYQGLYNPLNRVVERELIPILRKNGCSFVAYNPLAAGLLSGKHHKSDSEVKAGRFKGNANYLPRFYTDENFAALEVIRKACDASGITMVEATYRWLLRHSALTEADGLLLGASSVEQLDENLRGCAAAAEEETGPLSEDILTAFGEAWKVTEKDSFPYWRSYSSDMPGRENLDPGASYESTKK